MEELFRRPVINKGNRKQMRDENKPADHGSKQPQTVAYSRIPSMHVRTRTGQAEAHPIPVGGAPLAAFPLDCNNLLLDLPNGALSSLPRVSLAAAIGWNGALLQKLALERLRPVVMFKEGSGESDALGFLFEHWQVEQHTDDRDGDHFGVHLLRANLWLEYKQVADHEEGVRQGWEWLGNI
ncbi:hypothetical protein C8R41DRAFT_870037 [Lentinula lateritia]|uniref:Uncharacterized protein n=1 Tax=Lentinula lateritia TaxID=40482 RepID=A0ABQ8V548_9AGAR|nr:hypothetical protein C8R41DRAFT_870037 [Lentinula lateritia]